MAELDQAYFKADLTKIISFPGTQSPWPHLEAFVSNHILKIITDQQSVYLGKKTGTEVKRRVLVVSGWPLAGKTFVAENVGRQLQDYSSRFKVNGSSSRTITWEKDGEEVARRMGIITTPRGKPLRDDEDDNELKRVNVQLEHSAAQSIRENNSTVIEIPGETLASLVDGVWEGRQLGARLQLGLETRTPPFDDLPDFEVDHASLAGGSLLRALAPFRNEYKDAPDLPAAQAVAVLYGKKPPQTEGEWRDSIDGAVSEELDIIEAVVISLAERLQALRLISLPTGYNSIATHLQAELVEYTLHLADATKRKRKRDFRPLVAHQLARYFFTEVVPVDPKRLFLGLNDPSPEDLGIPDLEALGEHLKNRGRGRQRFAPT